MCPQIASNVKWNGNYVFGSDTLSARPELASIVAATISAWAITETHLGRAFAHLIGAKQPVSMNMYAAVRSFDVQRDMIIVAAREVLPRRYAILFEASLNVIKKASSDRNKFAHWIWGGSADPEMAALLLVEPKHFWSLAVKQAHHSKFKAKAADSPLISLLSPPKIDLEDIYVYQLNDLQEARNRVERAFWIAEGLRRLVFVNAAQRRSIYTGLCSEPDIQKAVEGVTKNYPVPPKARRKRPNKDRA